MLSVNERAFFFTTVWKVGLELCRVKISQKSPGGQKIYHLELAGRFELLRVIK